MNNLVSLKDLRTKLTDYTRLVSEHGNSFIVLKKSKPVFKIVPIEEDSWETVVDFTEIDKKGVSFADVKKVAAELLM
jgi:antitoxin (DNA-binding transcriptional repressor) of toxin-antitoxin stability system